MCLSVRGAMRWSKSRLKGLFEVDGRKSTADESWQLLADELAKGHEVLPLGECEGFDYVRGCPGHERPEVLP
jgi:hypothetical protein